MSTAFDSVAAEPIVRYCIVYPSTGETDLFLYTSRADAERAAEGIDDPLEIPYAIVEVTL